MSLKNLKDDTSIHVHVCSIDLIPSPILLTLPNTFLYRPAVVKLKKANNDKSDGAIIKKHGRHETQSLTGLADGVDPQVGKLANVVETGCPHFSTEESFFMKHTLLEGAVLPGCDNTLPQQAKAAWMKGDASYTLDSDVHLSSATASSAQNLSIVLIPTPRVKQHVCNEQ